VKFLERLPGSRRRLYQFTAIDDCTRIRVLKVFDACNQATAIRFIDDVIRPLPFRIHVVQTDNSAGFQSRFHWHLERHDIRHVYIRSHMPHACRIAPLTRTTPRPDAIRGSESAESRPQPVAPTPDDSSASFKRFNPPDVRRRAFG
jgi:hypothetical protein